MAGGGMSSNPGPASLIERNLIEKYQVLLSVAQELTSILDLDLLLGRVGHLLQEVIPHELFAILLYDEKREELVWKAGLGYSEESQAKVARFPVTQGLVGRAVRQRALVVSPDVSREPDYLRVRTKSGSLPRSEIAVPLIYQGRVIGAMSVECTRAACFTEEHTRLMTGLSNLVAIAIANASLYENSLRDAATTELLYDVSLQLTTILDLGELLERIADQVRRVIDYKIFAIYLVEQGSGDLLLKTTRGLAARSIQALKRLPAGKGLMGRAIRERRSFIVEDVLSEPDYLLKECLDGTPLSSQMNVPLLTKDRVVGVLSLETGAKTVFIPEHLRLMDAVAGEIAVALENAQLYEELRTRERKLQSDLELARELQLSLLPAEPPSLPGFEVGTVYQPADNLGGDYYDFVRLGAVRTGVLIADVCGKGVAAAMIMAASRSAVRSTAETEENPGAALRLANRRLCRDVKRPAYVTMCYGVLDPARGTFTYSSAGHYPPVCVRENGEILYLNAGGTILGVFEGAAFPEETVELRSGDLVCLYTDGIVDAWNLEDELYGERRLERELLANRRLPAPEIARRVLQSVQQHARGREQHDDMTLILLRSR
jgi:sigma-B regulation protein RsbU (phosphoserine phosphatase)